MDYKEKYETLNCSFDKVMIYHVGIDAGFFAEYTYMLNAMIYCLVNKIQFRMYADDANFGFERGWEDYFLPFCPLVHDDLHRKYNYHATPSLTSLWHSTMYEDKKRGIATFIKMLAWKIKLSLNDFAGKRKARKKYGHSVMFNSDVRSFSQARYVIPELDIDGDYLAAFRRMVDITWHFNDNTNAYKKSLVSELNIPEEFVGCQLRGGDKIIEVGSLLTSEFVIEKLRKLSDIKDAFVLTDDYRLYEQACKAFPDMRFITLCDKAERGYVNSAFTGKRGEGKRQQMLRFLTTVEILKGAKLFAGSITTGPSFFLLKYMQSGAVPVDWYEGRIAEIAQERIYVRNQKSEYYQKEVQQ